MPDSVTELEFLEDPAVARHLTDNYTRPYREKDRPALAVNFARWCADNGLNPFSEQIGRNFFGQAGQDLFVLTCLNNKTDGRFLEIGSNDPIYINNSVLLERGYGWRGIMVEFLEEFRPAYQAIRPNAAHVFGDALKTNYRTALETLDYPKDMDYLQIDLEWAGSLQVLCNLDKQILDDYRFAVVTYEHDTKGFADRAEARDHSRRIFADRGYHRVFTDVQDVNHRAYEDWYVHPALVDMDHVARFASDQPMVWKEILGRLVSTAP